MSKKCARPECGKTVYPIEELKCLDKVWHKQCFKCTVCGMTLNMKNYKGYGKMPYCEPHYPKTVASVVVDTPEMKRLAENTRLQSQIKYHEEFEKSKGQRIQVADDPEMMRHLRNTQVQSQVAYHGEYDKKKHQDEIRPHAETQLNQDGTAGSAANGKSQMSGAKTAQQRGSAASQSQTQQARMNGAQGAQTGLSRKQPTGFSVKALYDYTAADKDEVSFSEGDIIVNCQKVDEGWMTGTVQKTNQWGMLPANYVERLKQPTGLHYLNRRK